MARSGRSLYDVLGVDRSADADALRSAYRELARQLHPDVNPDDAAAEARFKEVSEAYAVLSDEQKRADYDEFGDIALDAGFDAEKAREAQRSFGGGFGGHPFGQGGGAEGLGGIEDLLGQLFGGRASGSFGGDAFGGGFGGRGFAMRGADAEAELALDFLDAANGSEQRLQLQGPAGAQTLTVRIPPGATDGQRIRLAGKGAPGNGGAPAGDLLVRLRVRPHPVFEVDGRNLAVELPVSVSEAVQGAKVEVPTLAGSATLTIPAGTAGGQRLRLRGKGLPAAGRNAAGDLYVTVRIQVPTDLDPELLAALADHEADHAARERERMLAQR